MNNFDEFKQNLSHYRCLIDKIDASIIDNINQVKLFKNGSNIKRISLFSKLINLPESKFSDILADSSDYYLKLISKIFDEDQKSDNLYSQPMLDHLYHSFIYLLFLRFIIGEKIGQLKKKFSQPALDSSRWQQSLEKKLILAKNNCLPIDAYKVFWTRLHHNSCLIQQSIIES